MAAASTRGAGGPGISLGPLERRQSPGTIRYSSVEVTCDPSLGAATIVVRAPREGQPATPAQFATAGASWWALTACRELDDAILHLRFNEPELGTWVLKTEGDPAAVLAVDDIAMPLEGYTLPGEEHVAQMIGKIARPASIVFTEELPKTRSGKIMRRLLRDISEQRQLGDVTTLANAGVVADIAERQAASTSAD